MSENQEKARFDAQLPNTQKKYFEYAASLAGHRSLTEFVLSAAQEKAEEIVDHHESLFASERDKEIFFDALLNPPAPNQALKSAMNDYKEEAKI